MIWAILRTLALVVVLLAATSAQAKGVKGSKAVNAAKTDQIDIEDVTPKSAEHRPVLELIKDYRTLEKVKQLPSPVRLPRRLLVKIEGCDGVSNAYNDDGVVTVWYELLDEVWKNVPEQPTPEGVAPIDALVGPVMDAFLHEAGHAVFDMLQVPLFGREEDAADQFSLYIILKMQKDEARRLIMGTAYQYKSDVESSMVSMPLNKFADDHGTPSQRYFNVLCLAYGADKELFADFVTKGVLPKARAEGCEDEYAQVDFAFARLITPSIDQRLASKLPRRWLLPIGIHPKKRR